MAGGQARLSGAASGAAVGTAILPGIGTAIGAVIGALVSGGKGTYAETTGLQATGYVDAEGFHGTVFGLAENAGKKYKDALPGWAPQSTLSAKAKQAFESAYGVGAPDRLQVDFIGPITETAEDPQFSDALAAAVRASKPADPLAALTQSFGANRAAAPTVVYTGAGDSTGITLGGNTAGTSPLALAALALGLFVAVKHV